MPRHVGRNLAVLAICAHGRATAFPTTGVALDGRKRVCQHAEFPDRLGVHAPPPARFAEPLAAAPRFYLFSLKALAFTLLRQQRPEEARAYLDQLQRLDPEDRIGAAPVQAVATAMA